MALAVSLQHIALLTVELGDRAAMSAKAVTCCIRIFEVLEGTDILNADILDMLPKELFLSTIENIQKQEARIDEFNTALSKICDGFPVFDSENQYLIALRELLKYTMQDQYDYIGWWLYEAPDAGYTVWWDDEDGKEIRVDLTEPGALYDYLVEYAAPEGVQEDEL